MYVPPSLKSMTTIPSQCPYTMSSLGMEMSDFHLDCVIMLIGIVLLYNVSRGMKRTLQSGLVDRVVCKWFNK